MQAFINNFMTTCMVQEREREREREHALTKQSWKWRRSKEAPMRRSLETALFTAVLIVDRAFGHVEE
jgi:hypothetical protein